MHDPEFPRPPGLVPSSATGLRVKRPAVALQKVEACEGSRRCERELVLAG